MASSKFKIRTYNNISPLGLDRFGANYLVGSEIDNPDAVLLRSQDLHNEPMPETVCAVARAGAGVNNIPTQEMGKKAIAVFNTPGANANSVKELVVASLLISTRHLRKALEYSKTLSQEGMEEAVEKGKKQFAGNEITGKVLGVIGLGAIGHLVANTGAALGMEVVGFDPVLDAHGRQRLAPQVQIADKIDKLLERSDFVTIHVPLSDNTKGLFNKTMVKKLKESATLLNFSRAELADELAIVEALNTDRLAGYITDFPNPLTCDHDKIIALPHLGASTAEAEDNCAMMAADLLKDFLENGNIRCSVNLPNVHLDRQGDLRVTIIYKNGMDCLDSVTAVLKASKVDISGLKNEMHNDFGYAIIDLKTKSLNKNLAQKISSVPGVLRFRILP